MPKTILVVEDNEINRKLVVDMVTFHKLKTLEARDADTAVTLATTHLPDLILMDIQLYGGMDGLDVVKIIRENPATASIPIIALTAFAMKGDKERVLAAGCEEYISKPFTMQQLMTMLRKYLGEF